MTHHDRLIKERDMIRDAYRDLFQAAAHFGHSHARMLDERDAILKRVHTSKKPLPVWVSSYVNAIWDQLQHDAWRTQLAYGGFVDGVFMSTWASREDYYARNGVEPKDWHNRTGETRGHYWINTHDGIPRLF